MHGLSRVLISAGAAAAVVALSSGLASASAVPGISFVSPIASGYAALPEAGGATSFDGVQTTFAVPAVTCTAQNATAVTRAGLDGITDSTAETVGVEEACVNAVPFYTAFYRMYPAALVPRFHPNAGDKVTASVIANASVYTLSVHDLTSGKSFTVLKVCNTCQGSSAGVTAGSLSGVPPANFGVVHFTNIVVADGAGVTGGLANAAWQTLKLTQPGSPHTVAGPLHTFSSPPHSAYTDTWAP
jgi:peptidase A4-like protein